MQCKANEHYAAGRMSAREFHIRNVTRMQGLLTAVVGAYLLLSAALCGYWWNWSRGWDAAAMVACFAVSAAVFGRVDEYYEEFVPRPQRSVPVGSSFHAAGSVALAVFAWNGYGIGGAAVVGAAWVLLLARHVGDRWGYEATSALALVVGCLLMLVGNGLFAGGFVLVVTVGGVYVCVGVLDWMHLRRAERMIREETDELGL